MRNKMSIDTSAVLIVGLLGSTFDEDTLSNMLDDFEVASYKYDADPKDCIVGYILRRSDGDTEIDFVAIAPEIKKLKGEFLKETGLEAKLYLSANVM